jgi:hypothetical protein
MAFFIHLSLSNCKIVLLGCPPFIELSIMRRQEKPIEVPGAHFRLDNAYAILL